MTIWEFVFSREFVFPLVFSLIGWAISIFAIRDSRRQRNAREKAVITAHSLIESTRGMLIGIKPGITNPDTIRAIDDALENIKQERSQLDTL